MNTCVITLNRLQDPEEQYGELNAGAYYDYVPSRMLLP